MRCIIPAGGGWAVPSREEVPTRPDWLWPVLLIARLAAADTKAACAAGVPADAAAPASPARIEAIEVRRVNVFTDLEAEEAFIPYGLANALHAVTRERVIRRHLLFGVGDPLDPERLAESERHLRSFRFFRKVSIEPRGNRVVVETRDAWTLIPRFALGRRGGVNVFQLGVEEANLLGTGRRVQARYEKQVDRTLWSLLFVDPQALGAHAGVRVLAQDLSDGEALQVEAGSPFFALDVRRAGGAAYRFDVFDAIRYAGGVETSRWRKREHVLRAHGGLLLAEGEDRALRALLSAEWSDTILTPSSGAPPPDEPRRRFFFIGLGLESEGRSWLKLRNVDQIDRDEDFNLAPGFALEAGASPSVGGARSAGRLEGRAGAGLRTRWGFARGALSGRTRFDGGARATAIGADLRAYALFPRLTLAARLSGAALGEPDPEELLELDGLNGMRGYRAHAAAGTRRLVANLEARAFLLSDVLHVFSVGAAAFLDEGLSSGPPDGPVHLTNLGVGLRIGLTRAGLHSLIRVDIARALRPDPLGRTGWLLSFATGQAF